MVKGVDIRLEFRRMKGGRKNETILTIPVTIKVFNRH